MHIDILCIAEKPSMSKALAKILSGGSYNSVPGPSKYNINYSFVYKLNNQDYNVVMTSLLGHLMNTEFANPKYHRWDTVDPEILFDAEIKTFVNDNMKNVAKNLSNNAKFAKFVYIWTDCDREGEHIGHEALLVCKQSNPRLVAKRARYSAVQAREVHNAMQNPVELDYRQVDAVESRVELDFRIGVILTRFQTLLLQRRFQSFDKKVISYGSCQFPTLGFIVDRYKKVKSFVPEEHYSIAMEHLANGSEKAVFKWKRVRLFDFEVCFALYSNCMENPIAKITNIDSRQKLRYKPIPLSTVEMEKLGIRYLKMNSDKIMKVAEQLYNKGFISYPRTETDIFDKNSKLQSLVEKHVGDPVWGPYAQNLVNGGGFQWPRSGKNDDKAHPPIHPTAHVNSELLLPDERKLYEMVVRRFLACCSKDAVGHQTTATANIGGETFTTSGLMISERNFLDIYTYGAGWNEQSIPVYKLNETFKPTKLEITTGKTTAPQLLDEADLIDIMNKSQVGTDATIHEHIKKVQEREYVIKLDRAPNKGRFLPSNLGFALVDGYDGIGLDLSLSKPYLRREMENLLKKICEGQSDKKSVIEHCLRLYRSIYLKTVDQKQIICDSVSSHMGLASSAPPPSSSSRAQNGSNAQIFDFNNPFSTNDIRQCHVCSIGLLELISPNNTDYAIVCNSYSRGNCTFNLVIPNRGKFIKSANVSSSMCTACTSPSKKIIFSFEPGSVPPFLPLLYEGCLFGCNQMLNEVLNVPPIDPTNSATNVSSRTARISTSATTNTSNRTSGGFIAKQNTAANTNFRNSENNQTTSITIDDFDDQREETADPTNSYLVRDSRSKVTTNNTNSTNEFSNFGSPNNAISSSNTKTFFSSTPVAETCGSGTGNATKSSFFSKHLSSASGATSTKKAFQIGNAAKSATTSAPIPTFSKTKLMSNNQKPILATTARKQQQQQQQLPQCWCNMDSIKRTVKKSGPNEGKMFWSCSLGQSGGCSFFEWA